MEINIFPDVEKKVKAVMAVNALTGNELDAKNTVNQMIVKAYESLKEELVENVLGILDDSEEKVAPRKGSAGNGGKTKIATRDKSTGRIAGYRVLLTSKAGARMEFKTQAEAAEWLGVTESTVHNAITDKYDIRGYTVERLANNRVAQPKAVVVTDEYGRDIVFDSIGKAAKHIGVTARAVSVACHGSGKTNGYKVRFKESSKAGIVVLDARGKECGCFSTQREAAHFCGVSDGTISVALQKGSKVNGFSVYERVQKENLDKMNY